MDILRLENVVKVYGKGGVATKALAGITFGVQPSEFVAVMGASGSGKTTLLNLIATIDTVSGGKIYVDGRDVTEMNEEELSVYRGRKLGFVFQEYNLLDTLTAYENIILPLTLRGTPRYDIEREAGEIMRAFGLTELAGKFPSELSGGERQRTACARALIGKPSLIMADEPTGALDSRNSRNLMRLLRMMNETYGATILTVTHDPAVASYATRVLFLRDGRLFNEVCRGDKTDEELYREVVEINAAAGGESYAV